MSSGIAPPPVSRTPGSSGPRSVDAEKYIDLRLEETRRHVRAVDLTVALLKLCIGVLFYLLAAMVVDQWVVAEGLGRGSRLALWAVLVLGAGWYCARAIVPLLIHRINPVFAAQTIEQTRPTFKNGLINFLLLRRDAEAIRRDDLSKRVYQGLQVRTASELSRVSVGTTVDRLHVIRLGYLLATLVAICCVYLVLSPKNPLVSFGRVILPWARIGAPTRVAIDSVTPGSTTAYQGSTVTVSAEIQGLRTGEPVYLYYSTIDGQSVDQSVPMSVPEGGYRYQGQLPPGSLGLQQGLLYWIAAGDAITPKFQIEMQIPPTILVDRIEYDYPAYTGLPRRVAIHEEDIRAIEGTRVTIHGTANYPVGQAYIELIEPKGGSSRPRVLMAADGSAATGQLTLTMSRADPSQQQYIGYQLRFTDPDRRENPNPIRHSITVIPDQKPDVRLVDPPPEEAQIPVTGFVALKVHAEDPDPDFGLRHVTLRAERGGRGLLIPALLSKPRPEKPHRGPFEATYRFEPARLDLKPGDKVTYWAEAIDCMEKADDPGFVGNVSETEKRTMLIAAADARQQQSAKQNPQQGPGQKGQPGQHGNANQQRDQNHQQPGDEGNQQGKKSKDKPQSDKGNGPKSGQPQDQDQASPKNDHQQGNPQQPGANPDESSSPSAGQQGAKPGEKPGNQPPQKGKPKSDSKKDQSNTGAAGNASPDNQEQGSSQSQGANQNPSGKSGEKSDSSGAKGEQPSSKVDGQNDPGDAIIKILDDKQQQQAKQQKSKGEDQPKSQSPPESQKPNENQSSDQRQPGGKSPAGEQQAASKPDKGATQQPNAGQDTSPDRKSGEPGSGQEQKSGGQKEGGGQDTSTEDQKGAKEQNGTDQNGNAQSKGMNPKNDNAKSAEAKGKDDKTAENKQPDEGVNAKPQAGPKGGSGEAKPDQASGANEQDANGSNNGSESKGGQTGARKGMSGGDKGKGGSQQSQTEPEAKKPGEQPAPGEKKSEKEAANTHEDQSKQNPGDQMAGKQPDESQRSSEKAKSTDAIANDQKETAQGRGDREKSDRPKGVQGMDQQPRREPGGTGERSDQRSPPPLPQGADQPNSKNQDTLDASKKKAPDNEAQSPNISPRTTKSKSDTEGDRSGGGGKGGSQNAQHQGAGSRTSANEGGGKSNEQGPGETGAKGGDKTQTNQPTGKSGTTKGEGNGTGSDKQSGGEQSAKQSQSGDSSQKNPEPGKSGASGNQASAGNNAGQKGGSTADSPIQGGGNPSKSTATAPPPKLPAPPPDDPNLNYARKQTTLALGHLADEMAKNKSSLLDRLGWDKAYAEKFYRQWEQMMKAAKQPGPKGEAAKQELDKALKSLGLRPTKSRVQKGKAGLDKLQRLQDAGRFPPPAEWTDYINAYKQGVGGGKD